MMGMILTTKALLPTTLERDTPPPGFDFSNYVVGPSNRVPVFDKLEVTHTPHRLAINKPKSVHRDYKGIEKIAPLKTLKPGGLPASFYQRYWDILGPKVRKAIRQC
ncbi:hypothetical protein ACOSQ2_019587 [Xanthoceras sorbifolium]